MLYDINTRWVFDLFSLCSYFNWKFDNMLVCHVHNEQRLGCHLTAKILGTLLTTLAMVGISKMGTETIGTTKASHQRWSRWCRPWLEWSNNRSLLEITWLGWWSNVEVIMVGRLNSRGCLLQLLRGLLSLWKQKNWSLRWRIQSSWMLWRWESGLCNLYVAWKCLWLVAVGRRQTWPRDWALDLGAI